MYLDLLRHEAQKLGKCLLPIHKPIHLQAHVPLQFLERVPAFQGTFNTARGRGGGGSDGKVKFYWGRALFASVNRGKERHMTDGDRHRDVRARVRYLRGAWGTGSGDDGGRLVRQVPDTRQRRSWLLCGPVIMGRSVAEAGVSTASCG